MDLFRLVHGSTIVARLGEYLVASSAISPCGHGVSRRQNIECCVLVSIVYSPAFRAAPLADRQWKSIYGVPAVVTPFAGGEEAIHFHKCFPIPLTLVLQEPPEQGHRGIVERASNAVVLDHSPYVEVLDADGVEAPYDVGSCFVHLIETGVGYRRVDPGDFEPLPLSSVAPLDPPGEDLLGLGKLLELGMEQAWVDDVLARRESGEPVDSEIDAYLCSGKGQRFNLLVEGQCHEVSAIKVLGYRHSGRDARKRSRPADIKASDLGEGEIAVSGVPLEGTLGVLGRLFASLALERRVGCTLLEEVTECSLEMPECLLGRNTGYLVEPCSIGGFLQLGEQGRGGVVADALAGMVGVGSSTEPPVVDESACAKGPRKSLLLRRRGVKAESVSRFHKVEYNIVSQLCKERRSAIPLPTKAGSILAQN